MIVQGHDPEVLHWGEGEVRLTQVLLYGSFSLPSQINLHRPHTSGSFDDVDRILMVRYTILSCTFPATAPLQHMLERVETLRNHRRLCALQFSHLELRIAQCVRRPCVPVGRLRGVCLGRLRDVLIARHAIALTIGSSTGFTKDLGTLSTAIVAAATRAERVKRVNTLEHAPDLLRAEKAVLDWQAGSAET